MTLHISKITTSLKMKLFLIILIGYVTDCCAFLGNQRTPISRKELIASGHIGGIDKATIQFIEETVDTVYHSVIEQANRGTTKSYRYNIKPSDDLIYHAKINYWDNITQELKRLFPDSEVEHNIGSGLTVYWG